VLRGEKAILAELDASKKKEDRDKLTRFNKKPVGTEPVETGGSKNSKQVSKHSRNKSGGAGLFSKSKVKQSAATGKKGSIFEEQKQSLLEFENTSSINPNSIDDSDEESDTESAITSSDNNYREEYKNK
jgi:hypothetical protein